MTLAANGSITPMHLRQEALWHNYAMINLANIVPPIFEGQLNEHATAISDH